MRVVTTTRGWTTVFAFLISLFFVIKISRNWHSYKILRSLIASDRSREGSYHLDQRWTPRFWLWCYHCSAYSAKQQVGSLWANGYAYFHSILFRSLYIYINLNGSTLFLRKKVFWCAKRPAYFYGNWSRDCKIFGLTSEFHVTLLSDLRWKETLWK